jgi:hypothetical protein
MLCTFERKIIDEFMTQYKIKDAGTLHGIVKFRVYTEM